MNKSDGYTGPSPESEEDSLKLTESLKHAMSNALEKAVLSEFDGFAGTATESGDDGLTLDRLSEVVNLIKSLRLDLYYETSKFLEKGNAWLIPAGEFHPRYLACHPDSLAAVAVELGATVNLMPLKDYSPSDKELERRVVRRLETISRNIEASTKPVIPFLVRLY